MVDREKLELDDDARARVILPAQVQVASLVVRKWQLVLHCRQWLLGCKTEGHNCAHICLFLNDEGS